MSYCLLAVDVTIHGVCCCDELDWPGLGRHDWFVRLSGPWNVRYGFARLGLDATRHGADAEQALDWTKVGRRNVFGNTACTRYGILHDLTDNGVTHLTLTALAWSIE